MRRIEDFCCFSVKIQCGNSDNGGTGTIISDGSQYYVMTAAHCVSKSKSEFFQPEEITLISYAYNTTTTIKVLRIDDRSRIENDLDFALLEIENPDLNFDYFNNVKRCDEIVTEDNFFFYGYGGPDKDNHGRAYHISRTGQNQWHLIDENIASQSQPAMNLMKGNSGAGVFFQRMGIFYCIGYVKCLYDEEGSYNDIIVFPTSLFDGIIPQGTKESNYFELVKNWNKDHDAILEQEAMVEYRNNNVQYMQNLERKMAILYPYKDEAKEKVEMQLSSYLTGLKLVTGLRQSPHIYNMLKKSEDEAYEEWADLRSSHFSDSSKALDDLRKVRKTIKETASRVLGCDRDDNMKQLVKNYANYELAERLLICSLDYK